MFTAWHNMRGGTLTREAFKTEMIPIMRSIEAFLEKGLQASHTKTQGTCREILKLKKALWTFVETLGVEPTNNLAERVLRQIVIWRKVCFGTWSENGSLYLGRVMGVVATCRLQKRSVFGFLCDAIQAHLTGEIAPSLLPAVL
jgi:transposase